ncbi:ChaN family lipoprotein [cf. Phormidesmis sp. LEGE 11477]|uniref:ChaN family lipoprotein n=1 Tax=cf. Phormidesmis sp. LEGE 11477 TaxID=1828680 RepID=UPI0018820AA6|nr:ChaN family lipoprotein [cf. Phormidesmis sp. LEGE 11477]MBE9060023.1 ChaN family lipoprotein [cf. Phormidesmis sp. LEGE 11477]
MLAALSLASINGQSAIALESGIEDNASLLSKEKAGEAIAQNATSTKAEAANAGVLDAIAASQVIYLAETHDSRADHIAQLDIIKALDETNELAIGLEMFQRPFQSVLDDYLAGIISEADLVKQSEYETRWGFDWEFYAPIIRYAKDNQIPVIALNAPTEATRQVAREGLESLEGDLLKYVPPVAEIDTTDEAYRASVARVFGAHGHGSSLSFENFFAAQVLWDETMAESVVRQLEKEPERQIVVLSGEGHIAFDYGIPSRVERRLPDIDQASVRLSTVDQPITPNFTDFVWITP